MDIRHNPEVQDFKFTGKHTCQQT